MRALCVHFVISPGSRPLTAGKAQLQHYTEPSGEPFSATSSAVQYTILLLGSGRFAQHRWRTHHRCGYQADLIDDITDLIGTEAFGMGEGEGR